MGRFRPRLILTSLFAALGRFFHFWDRVFGALILVVAKAEDLEELVKRSYRTPRSLRVWGEEAPEKGLTAKEIYFVSHFLKGKKSCFVFQCGGGRESFVLARLGYEVTGIDTCDTLLERAKAYASAHGFPCHFERQSMFENVPVAKKFDALFLTKNMYSAIPTRKKRITFLKNSHLLLRDDGYFYLEFWPGTFLEKESRRFRWKKKIAELCRGNIDIEIGDTYHWNINHFTHIFPEASKLLDEFREGGFDVVEDHFEEGHMILAPSQTP